MCEEDDFELYAVNDGQCRSQRTGVMWSPERVWVSRQAAKFWMY